MTIKRISALFLCLALIVCFAAGCGKPEERELFNTKLSKIVKLNEYNGIKVDTSSAEFKEFYDAEISSDVSANGFYVKKTEGVVAKGDTANIDYTGKKDGVAFEGGTAQGYDLTIGSNSFIAGFEDGLIGVAIGSTVDLNLTFPENYHSADLAGKAVVFTVKVNYVTTTEGMKPEDYYSELKFTTLKAYTDDVTKRAVNAYLVDKVISDTEVSECPAEDKETLINAIIEMQNAQAQATYGVDFNTVLSSNDMTIDDFKQQIDSNIDSMLEYQIVLYAIFDAEKLEIDAETLKSYESIGSDALQESSAVEEIVIEHLNKNAVIK